MPEFALYFFWISLFILLYTYIFYGILLLFLVKIKSFFTRNALFDSEYFPQVTLLIAAFNEAEYIRDKILNTVDLDYPREKISILVVADGSTDETPQIVKEFPEVTLLHKKLRLGKVSAVNRAMREVTDEIVIFSDQTRY